MKIYLRKDLCEIPGYKSTFQPDKDGKVDMKTLQKVWNCDESKATEIINNHPDFYVDDTPHNRRQTDPEKRSETESE